MQQYHSVGVSTLVALLAAHRAAAQQGGGGAALDLREIARIETALRDRDPARVSPPAARDSQKGNRPTVQESNGPH